MWVFCPHKPHPFRNEDHRIRCGLTGIMFDTEFSEGKDHPGDTPTDNYENIGKTVCLLVWIYHHIYSAGKFVIIGSGFWMLQQIIELRKFFFCKCSYQK